VSWPTKSFFQAFCSSSQCESIRIKLTLSSAISISKCRLGKSSVTYGVALFASAKKLQTADISSNTFRTELEMMGDTAAAFGEMTHVFVDPHTRRPVPIPETMRAELSKLQQ
jgi:acyl-CoA thioester hydrolase